MQKTVRVSILLSFFCLFVSCSNNYQALDRLLESGAYREVLDHTSTRFRRNHDPKLLIYRAQALDRLGQSSKALDTIKLYNALTPLSKQEQAQLSFELALKNRDWIYLITQAEMLEADNRLTIDQAKGYYRALLNTGRTEDAKTLFSQTIQGTSSPSEEVGFLISTEVDPKALAAYLSILSTEEQIALVLKLVPIGLDPSIADAWFISLRMQKSDTIELYRALALLAGQAGRRYEEARYALLYQTSKEAHE
ncbi:MAG TPA: hypothetical protein PLW47_05150 [Sphaerochaeta sp.]|jgi:hypothetical protein|nr:hypothetical protein [Sphaerochaeta sp.]